jgi:hypothetical protein
MITKPVRNNHNNTSRITNNRSLGESISVSSLSDCFGVAVIKAGLGVIIAGEMLVRAGNINVIAGKGKSVVVGVTEGVVEGVNVSGGVPGIPAWVEVVVPKVSVPVAWFTTAA